MLLLVQHLRGSRLNGEASAFQADHDGFDLRDPLVSAYLFRTYKLPFESAIPSDSHESKHEGYALGGRTISKVVFNRSGSHAEIYAGVVQW